MPKNCDWTHLALYKNQTYKFKISECINLLCNKRTFSQRITNDTYNSTTEKKASTWGKTTQKHWHKYLQFFLPGKSLYYPDALCGTK